MAVKRVGHRAVGFREGRRSPRKEAPTLVMIHGAGINSELWSNQLDLLGDDINVIALDLSGHGQSDKESLDNIAGHADWLHEVLENWFEQPIYLVGHSMGGAIAQEMAIAHAHLLKGLILVATGARLKVAPQFLDGLLDDFENTVDTIMSYAFSKDGKTELVGQWASIMKKPGQPLFTMTFWPVTVSTEGVI